jgi:hypothetical protein
MPRFEIELDDKGEFVGDIPAPLKAFVDQAEIKAHGNGYRNGASETATKAQKEFEERLARELAKKDALAPLEREKLARYEEENTALNTRLTEAMRESNTMLRSREEAHARELLSRSDAIKARDVRLQALVGDQLESLALAAGARDESLSELKVILGAAVAFDDDMQPYVKGDDGRPRLQSNGQPISLKAFVRDYVETHPHHRRPASGVGGGARGGATFQGYTRDTVGMDAAKKRIESGDRSPTAINELFEASRQRKAAG